MFDELHELADTLGGEWIDATPERRAEIEAKLQGYGCRVSITEAGNLCVEISDWVDDEKA